MQLNKSKRIGRANERESQSRRKSTVTRGELRRMGGRIEKLQTCNIFYVLIKKHSLDIGQNMQASLRPLVPIPFCRGPIHLHLQCIFRFFIAAILNCSCKCICSCVSLSASLSANVSVSVSVSSIRIDGSAIVLVFQLSFNDSSLVSLKRRTVWARAERGGEGVACQRVCN